jgi:myb proto-oncogene protein
VFFAITLSSALELHNTHHPTFPTQTYSIIGRDNKQCLERWVRVLDPQISKAPWSKEEYRIILKSQQNGPVNKWAHISKHLSGRTGKSVKILWNNFLKKKVEKYVYSLNIDSKHMIKDSEGRYLIDDIDKCLSSL